MDQNEVFLRSEGNAWYERNKSHLIQAGGVSDAVDTAFLCTALSPFRDRIEGVLEIGCSSGLKLETVCEHQSASGDGIEPSQAAVDEGNRRRKFVPVRLQVGTGDALPFEGGSFGLGYFGFCLYLFDRASLLKSLAEADRELKPGGFLAITDFDPGTRLKRSYSNFEGVYSFKQDYTAAYTASGLHNLVEKHSYSHRHRHFDEDVGERVSTSILFKEREPYPIVT